MLKKIGLIIVDILLAAYVIAIVPFTAACEFFGIHPYAVTSGSMEPAIQTGSLVLAKETPFKELEIGEVITFMIGKDQTVTHRITAVDSKAHKFTTKGDANNTEDARRVSYKNVVGKVILHIPKAGYLLVMSGTKGRFIFIAGAGVALIALSSLLQPSVPAGKRKASPAAQEKEAKNAEKV